MLIKKIFGAILLLTFLIAQQNVSAEKTDWYDRNFNFRGIRSLIVFDMTFVPSLNYGNAIELRNMQEIFLQNSRKLKCNVITEAQARQTLSYQLGMNLNAMPFEQARHIIIQNAYRIADGWILGTVDNLANTYYIEPEHTVWEQRRETRKYYDARGQRHEEVYYIQVPVTYPPRRVDTTTLEVTLQVYESRGGSMIFARRDVRDREDYQAQKGMFGRITNSFFDDVGKRIR